MSFITAKEAQKIVTRQKKERIKLSKKLISKQSFWKFLDREIRRELEYKGYVEITVPEEYTSLFDSMAEVDKYLEDKGFTIRWSMRGDMHLIIDW